jgi:proteasome lid subunit RPN8/RPN11
MTARGSSGAGQEKISRRVRLPVIREGSSMLRIPKMIFQAMLDHAKRESPLECCGILGGKDKTVIRSFELQNTEKSPMLYSMSPQEQMKVFEEMERESMEMIATYHSHPKTIPFPSETDVKLTFYPDVSSVIISLKEEGNPVTKSFQIRKEAIYLEEIEVIS